MDEDASLPGAPAKKPLTTRLIHSLTTRDGLIGNYDYAALFRPNIPFLRRKSDRFTSSPFFGLNDKIPLVLALLLGFQHALSMLAGIITPPMLLGASSGANLEMEQQQYLVSAALIVSGILSAVQITRFHILKTPYYIGTGLLSVVGPSFTLIPIATGAFEQMYSNGFCPSDPDGKPLPCPKGYGALLGTCALCALLEILISFISPKVLLKMFPPIVTGPTVMLIGVKLIKVGFQAWLGGSGPCSMPSTAIDFFEQCPNNAAPNALPWGSPEFLGLGFSVFISIIFCERFGSPIMKSTSVAIGLLVGCIIAAATGYFDRSGIDAAPVANFIWLQTFPLTIYPPLILPVMAVYIIVATEAIGDISATCDVSRLEIDGETYESRIQGGILSDGLGSCLATLMTITPMSCFAQNNGVVALTRCANRKAGYMCCILLITSGVFAKFAASLVAIPSAVLGGMTTFLFCAVAVSGMAIIARPADSFDRRSRFILSAGLALGYGATLLPSYFDHIFSYSGNNKSLQGFLDAITLIMETGFAVCAIVCTSLNLFLPAEIVDDVEVTNGESNSSGTLTAQTVYEETLRDGDEAQTSQCHDISAKGEKEV